MLLTSKSMVAVFAGGADGFWDSAAPGRPGRGTFPGGAVWAKSTATPIDAEKANLNKVDSCLSNLTCQAAVWARGASEAPQIVVVSTPSGLPVSSPCIFQE